MDRKSLREFTHRASNYLSISDKTYKQWVFRYTFLELEKDLNGVGDITSLGIFHGPKRVVGKVFAREGGVFAGKQEIEYFLRDASKNFRPSVPGDFDLNFLVKDGASFKKEDLLLEITADVRDLLAVERSVLNLLMRMSGVATYTSKMLDIAKDCDVLITPTRKTLWGLLDKRAVVLGGGGTHRLNLADAVLIKDTHMDLIDRNYEMAFKNIALKDFGPRFVEVEVSSVVNFKTCVEALLSSIRAKELRSIGVILLDNMSPGDVSKCLVIAKEEGWYDELLFEASGSINEKTLLSYAQTGVDIVSMGSVTNGPRSLNFSMKSFLV